MRWNRCDALTSKRLDVQTFFCYTTAMSSQPTQKTTLYLQPAVKKFLQHKAIEEGQSMSEIVNELIEDMLDSAWLAKNKKRIISEGTISSEEMLAELGLTRESLYD